MNWKLATVLTAALAATGGVAKADDDRSRHRHPYFPPSYGPTYPLPGYKPVFPQSIFRPVSPRELERLVEHTLRLHLGHCVRDVDVDVNARRGCVDIEVEVRRGGFGVVQQIKQVVYSIPELRGYKINLDIDD